MIIYCDWWDGKIWRPSRIEIERDDVGDTGFLVKMDLNDSETEDMPSLRFTAGEAGKVLAAIAETFEGRKK